MRTMWHPLSMREGLFIGKVTAGPVRVQFQIKCFDFNGGGGLTGVKLESDPSEKLPSPTAEDERDGKTAAMKSSAWLGFWGTSEMEAMLFMDTLLFVWVLGDFEACAPLARWASCAVRTL